MEFELSKFGPIEQIKITTLNDGKPEEIGRVLVKFSLITSAFGCYNLLNGKPYLGKPIDI